MNQYVKAAWIETIPVIFGYVPLGLAFGLLLVKSGAPWYWAPCMSLVVFAGAAQFVAVSVLALHGSLLSLALSTFLINLRHIFYGVSFAGKFPTEFFKKNYMIFGLTDESYAILTTTTKDKHHHDFYFWVIFISHGYWVLGSLLGALLGKNIDYDLSFLKFALTALFVVLMIEQAYKIKRYYPFLLASVTSAMGLLWPDEMLLVAIGCLSLGIFVLYKKGYA